VDELGPAVPVKRVAVESDFRGKSMLGLSVKADNGIYGARDKKHPDVKELPAGVTITWYPTAGLFCFRKTRVDTADGDVPPVEVVEERWLNDSTDQILWWETPSKVFPVTPRSK
jgi:hypothetical protein